ncbi:glycosyltransferase family 39 protein [Gemmata sp. G18]|uniref:Glycosyltransferase family 39 protein n=1 Tax=Gemmata palustris TaxID=2822762 RepID=A0ABS5BX57_9BACT|nr:glycosyltransferase family 39 protein [Gemmata palustris]MBP3958286.1 glycosyltransferase family 39 protein [Gemmata palustris]
MRLAPAFVAGWCAFLFLYGAAAGPVYRTESLRAIIGRSCLEGHWLYPVLYGEPFLTKPPGHYVAIGLCSLPFGEVTAAAARLPSVLAATLAVVLMHGMFRRVLGERAALLVAVLLPCSVLWLDKVPSAEIDMTLVGWVTAVIVLFHRALESRERESLWLIVAALLCVAGGTLTKWTAPAFFYLTVVPLLAWRRQLALLFGWRHLLAVGVACAACALWAGAVVREVGWDALADTIRKEAAYRFAPKASKGYPWTDVATYPLAVFAAHLPVSAFALLTFRRSFWAQWDERGKLLLQLLHCWTWPNLLFWTLVPNHNVRYALPMSAGLMGLGVMGLIAWLKRPSRLEVKGEERQPNPLTPFPKKEGGTEPTMVLSPSPLGGGVGEGLQPLAGRVRLIVAFLLCWLVAKVVFVEVVIPQRTAGRNAEATGAALREHVPVGEPLFVLKLKDEGVMFYYARPASRLTDVRALPPGAFAVLIRQEWEDRAAFGHLELVSCMNDQQGDPIYLVRNSLK